ncbi:helix-turn-helix domain-containing protein [Bremerella cremea]|uniref:AraC family transcriptional regulator n=1 Tax=Blastopirellula marina TaxID=124 RepID=A0A2S8G8K1_9BACT|nr:MULTISPECIES: DNA-binding transcriptional regulator [Pirellulaceae]PQO40444.1 AraC family transcriptional regulator [Blastopirellula marina]RCS52026.1 helix-turn-helix domain-containing protein [Bremerella cremea]
MALEPSHLDERRQVQVVAVLVETETSWGRRVIRGIAHYAEKHASWHLLIDPRDHDQRSALPDGWRGHGVIARFSSRLQIEQILQKKVPAVDVDDVCDPLPGVGRVITDESARAELAVEHLLARGFSQFAYFAPPSHRYSSHRGEAFQQAVTQRGYTCHTYRPGYRAGRKMSWAEQQRRVNRWLMSLPRPIAILAVDAHHARQLAEVCHFSSIRVPDEFAILAGDSDELLCEVSTPPLSAVSLACERIGYEAAAMLHQMIEGKQAPREPVLIAPHGVVSRQSTDFLAIDDPLIVRALRFIQNHTQHGIGVDDVLREVPLSRRSLEIQFKSYLGRTPAEEIRRVQLERARELLLNRDMSITEVALSSGFSNATRFGIAFRKKFGTTPRNFRKKLLTE